MLQIYIITVTFLHVYGSCFCVDLVSLLRATTAENARRQQGERARALCHCYDCCYHCCLYTAAASLQCYGYFAMLLKILLLIRLAAAPAAASYCNDFVLSLLLGASIRRLAAQRWHRHLCWWVSVCRVRGFNCLSWVLSNYFISIF